MEVLDEQEIFDVGRREDAERLKPTTDKGSQKQDDTAYTSW